MEFHRGRLIDHIHLRAKDLEASKQFYRAALQALGKVGAIQETPEYFSADELWIDRADGSVSRVHLAFQAADRHAVKAFYDAALAAGGRDNGAPGERKYHAGYYAAFAERPSLALEGPAGKRLRCPGMGGGRPLNLDVTRQRKA